MQKVAPILSPGFVCVDIKLLSCQDNRARNTSCNRGNSCRSCRWDIPRRRSYAYHKNVASQLQFRLLRNRLAFNSPFRITGLPSYEVRMRPDFSGCTAALRLNIAEDKRMTRGSQYQSVAGGPDCAARLAFLKSSSSNYVAIGI